MQKVRLTTLHPPLSCPSLSAFLRIIPAKCPLPPPTHSFAGIHMRLQSLRAQAALKCSRGFWWLACQRLCSSHHCAAQPARRWRPAGMLLHGPTASPRIQHSQRHRVLGVADRQPIGGARRGRPWVDPEGHLLWCCCLLQATAASQQPCIPVALRL